MKLEQIKIFVKLKPQMKSLYNELQILSKKLPHIQLTDSSSA